MLHLDFNLILASKSTRLDYGTEGIEIEALKKTPTLATKIPPQLNCFVGNIHQYDYEDSQQNLHPRSFKMDIQDTPITLQKTGRFSKSKRSCSCLDFSTGPSATHNWNLGFHEAFHQTSKEQEPSGAKWVQKSKSTLTTKIPNDIRIYRVLLTIPNTYIAGNFVHRFWGSKPSSIISLWSSSRCNKNAKAYTLTQQNPLLCSGGKTKKA